MPCVLSLLELKAAVGVRRVSSARKGDGYTYLSGTSMASPYVAGVAALWAERQLKRNGLVHPATLDAQLRAHARLDRLPSASDLDVGEGATSRGRHRPRPAPCDRPSAIA